MLEVEKKKYTWSWSERGFPLGVEAQCSEEARVAAEAEEAAEEAYRRR